MRRTVAWIKNEYGDIPIVITENGFSDKQGNLDDLHRIYYLKHYINQLLKGNIILQKGKDTFKETRSFQELSLTVLMSSDIMHGP